MVGIFGVVVADEVAGEPIVIAPIRVGALLETVGPHGFGFATYADTAIALCADWWEVDIERNLFGQMLAEHSVDNMAYVGNAGIEVGIGMVVEKRESDSIESVVGGFEHGSHSAGIEHIDRGIAAVIDAAEYEVGRTLAKVFFGKFDAIYWSARATIHS